MNDIWKDKERKIELEKNFKIISKVYKLNIYFKQIILYKKNQNHTIYIFEKLHLSLVNINLL